MLSGVMRLMPKGSRLGSQQPQASHNHPRSAEPIVWLCRAGPGQKVACYAGEICCQQGHAGSITSHGQPKQNKAEDGITGEMARVRMQPDRREQTPPLAVTYGRGIEDTRCSQIKLGSVDDMKRADQGRPHNTHPVKEQAWLKGRAPQTPAAIFRSVQSEHFQGCRMVSRRN